jgi:ABC-type oligopeptide transport system substrate-binding subunit
MSNKNNVREINFKMCRQKILTIFFIFIVCSLIIGCSTREKEGKTVQLPFPDILGFNPVYWQSQHILAQGTIFEGLFGYAPDPEGLGRLKVVPEICQSYEVSEDGKTWIFKLRKDKKWSNGDPLTAEDFVWSFRYYASTKIPDIPYWASPVQFLLNAWPIKSGAEPEENLGIEALDDYTLKMELTDPNFNLDCWLAIAGGVPVHRKSVEAHPDDWWRPEYLVSNGPYMVKKWIQGTSAELVKNPYYVGKCGNVDRIILKFLAVWMQMGLQSFQAKELDLVFLQNVGEFKYVTSSPKMKPYFHETISDLAFQGYQISRGFSPVLDDKKLRMAFAMSIDRETLAEKVLGNRAVSAYKIWDDGTIIGREMKNIPYDPQRARELLAEAGYPDGKGLPQLRFYIGAPNNAVAEYVVDQWKKNLGLNVLVENIEQGLYWSKYVWGDGFPEIQAGFALFGGPMNSFNSGALTKNLCHTMWYFDYPAEIRQRKWDLYNNERNIKIRMMKKGTVQSDWDELFEKKNALWEVKKKILSSEPSDIWRQEMTKPPTNYQQFDQLYNEYKQAKNDDEKIQVWRGAAQVLIDEEIFQLQYNNMSENLKAIRRDHWKMIRMPFEEAVNFAAIVDQPLQDEFYMVPLYLDKIQYIKNPKLSGEQIYKFSFGPQVFNFKYLNLSD